MKKFFISFALFAALVFVVSCGGGGSKTGDNTDTGDTVTDSDTADTDSPSDTEPSNSDTEPSDNPDTEPSYEPTSDPTSDPTTEPTTEPTSDPTTDPTGEQEEGIYLGIIGFNYKLNIRNLSYLTNSNMTDFQDFIDDFEMDDGTALYFADYTALKMMRDYTPVPPQLQTVALVTFTDGEDTSSDGPTNDPENYNDPDVYLNAIHNKIVTNGIHGLSVEAYSIGLRSGDTGSDFKSRLEKLASSSDNAFEVADMDEVQDRFTKIAEDLYSVFKTINIDFKVLGNYSDGTRMRFTLDIYCDHDENVCEKNGSYSNLYIDATYRRSGNERSFENFAYHGFSGNLTTVKCGERDEKGFYPCTFGNLQYDNMDTEVKQIELWKNDSSEWKHENEALKQGDSKVNESKSSALIMLVLDCTTSLGNSKFEKLKEAGKDFIETLVNGGSGVTTTPCDNDPCSGIANSTGICTPSGTNYVCGCNSGYDWNGTQCVKPATPCDPNPCTSISNSNGNCTVSGASYVCGCNSGYNWNGTQCLDVAAEECASVSGSWNSSTGKCTRTQNCSSKPANTVWNTVSSITQTYNYDDEIWEPSTTSSFNETAARLSAAINVHQATTGTVRHALILRQKNVRRSAAHGTAPAASAQELKTVRQNLPTQCGTRFPASHRPGTAQRGNLRRHRATTQAAARLSAVTNAQQTTSGTALRAWLPSPNAAQLHRPRARIHLPAISGLQRHQRPTHGRMQLITATAIQKAA